MKQTLIGYRAWGLVRREGVWLLQSVASSTQTWLGPAVSANEGPTLRDSTGIYAFKKKEYVELEYDEFPVFGSIQLFGRVIEHKFGYRAEKAVMRDLRLDVMLGDNKTRTIFHADSEVMHVVQLRGRLRGEVKLVTRFARNHPLWTMQDVEDARKALETRYQVEVTINLEEID